MAAHSRRRLPSLPLLRNVALPPNEPSSQRANEFGGRPYERFDFFVDFFLCKRARSAPPQPECLQTPDRSIYFQPDPILLFRQPFPLPLS